MDAAHFKGTDHIFYLPGEFDSFNGEAIQHCPLTPLEWQSILQGRQGCSHPLNIYLSIYINTHTNTKLLFISMIHILGIYIWIWIFSKLTSHIWCWKTLSGNIDYFTTKGENKIMNGSSTSIQFMMHKQSHQITYHSHIRFACAILGDCLPWNIFSLCHLECFSLNLFIFLSMICSPSRFALKHSHLVPISWKVYVIIEIL